MLNPPSPAELQNSGPPLVGPTIAIQEFSDHYQAEIIKRSQLGREFDAALHETAADYVISVLTPTDNKD